MTAGTDSSQFRVTRNVIDARTQFGVTPQAAPDPKNAQIASQVPYKRCADGVFRKVRRGQQMRSSESEERQVHRIPKENIDRCPAAY